MKVDAHTLQLFAEQHGVVGVSQLIESGRHRSAVWRWTRDKLVTGITPGVVMLAGTPLSFETQAMALQLAVSPEGYLSGLTAGRLYGLRGMPQRRVYATSSVRTQAKLPDWATVRHTDWHDEDDVTLRGGFRLEEPNSMIFTIAAVGPDARLERAAEDAWRMNLVTPDSLADFVSEKRRRGRSGVARLERWIWRTERRMRPMDSHFEVDVVDELRRLGLPEPVKQHPLELEPGNTIHYDLAWPAIKLAVEPGHSTFHGGRQQEARDHRRDLACAALGWQVLRFNEEARADLGAVAREIVACYTQRAALRTA